MAQIIVRIDLGLISNVSDVLSELQLIELKNETGTLAKIINFLTQLALRDDLEAGQGAVDIGGHFFTSSNPN